MTEPRKSIPIIPAQTPEEERADISSCSDAEPYALRVIGDSMTPEFQEGHVIIVDPAQPLQHGAYVVIDYNGETTFRQFIVEDGRKFLKAINNSYPSVELVGSYTVRGVVVQRAGRRRRDRKHYY